MTVRRSTTGAALALAAFAASTAQVAAQGTTTPPRPSPTTAPAPSTPRTTPVAQPATSPNPVVARAPRYASLDPAPSTRPALAANAAFDSTAFAALKWREIGPYRGGRSVAVAGSSKRPSEYYMGTTGGGVFKTTDGGFTWLPVTDRYFGGTIGGIAVSESNPDIVYVGGGEYPIRGNVSHGDGVWRSDDAGKTWRSLGLKETHQISRVRVHPTNPDIVYVAAQGHVFGPNPERGIFKSTDGGKSWRKVLFRNDSTGAADLAMDPSNPDVLYAGFWQAHRRPWQLVSGGPGSGIFKSTDGGATWREISRAKGLPQTGLIGNIGLSVSPVKPSRVWLIMEHDSGGVFRSDDGGASWTRTNDERKLRQRAWYYTKIYADSKDTNTVYVSNVSFHRSTDGGKTFRAIRTQHGDSHDFWVAPNDNQRMIEGNDGGANVSLNGGRVWTDEDFATAQFYHVTTTNHFPYRVCGAQQDNSTLCGPSRKAGGITMADWYDAGGGESGYIAVRPDDPDVMYAGSYGGFLTRKDARTEFERDVNPWPVNPMGHDAKDARYRFQWTFPIVLSPHDPNTMYVGSSVIFKTTNEGQSYEPISPDLTRNDPATLGPSGGPITKDQTSVEYYATVFTIAESPLRRGVIWSGSDDGLIQVTQDAGKTWTNVTPQGLPEWARVSIIEASRHRPGGAYAAINRYQLDDFTPYIYKTEDYGRTWTKITAGIAPDEFVRVVREDPVQPGLLYAGTERGVWVSFNDGASWQSLRLNRGAPSGGAAGGAAGGAGGRPGAPAADNGLPLVPIHDLAVKEGDLVAGTHGRSFWILDDLSALRQMTPEIVAKPAHLFRPRDTYRTQWGGGFGGGRSDASRPVGQNPPSGATVYYSLKQPNQLVTLDFLDARGAVIKSFTSKQDSLSARDSVRRDSVSAARRDSLTRAGISADSVRKLEARSEGAGEGAPGGAEEEEGPRRAPRPPRVANRVGLNSFTWNLRYPDASSFENMILWAGGTQGPLAPPGVYAVRMAVNGRPVATQRFNLRPDPRATATPNDYAAQFALLTRIRDKVTQANDAVKTVRNVRAQLAARQTKLAADRRQAVATPGEALMARLSAIEGELYQVRNRSGQDPLNYPIKLNNQLSALANVVASADARPTQQSYDAYALLAGQIDAHLAQLKQAMATLLPPVNTALRTAGATEIVPSTAEIAAADGGARSGGGDDDNEEGEKQRRW